MERELDQDFERPRFSDVVEGEVLFRQFANAVVEAEADKAGEACAAEVHQELNFEQVTHPTCHPARIVGVVLNPAALPH